MDDPLQDDSYDDVTDILGASLERLNCETDAILESIRLEIMANHSNSGNRRRHQRSDDSDDDDAMDYQDELEDEMQDEILNLGSVTATIQKEMDDISVESVLSNMTALKGFQEEEEEVPEGMHLLQRWKLYGPGVGGKSLNNTLCVFASLIWALLIVLAVHVRFAKLDGNGALHWMPTLFLMNNVNYDSVLVYGPQ